LSTHSFLSQIHLEIAGCLDCLGRDDESRAELRLAANCLDLPPVDALGWLVQGRLFAAKDLKQATSFGIDSHHARLAEQRIRELASRLSC
jgi:hypothetical protein